MAKLGIIATMNIAPGRRDEYLKYLSAHRARSLANEPGTLSFEILVPHDQPDTLLLYEVYTSAQAFEEHRNGASMQQARSDGAGLVQSLTVARCMVAEEG